MLTELLKFLLVYLLLIFSPALLALIFVALHFVWIATWVFFIGYFIEFKLIERKNNN